MDRSAFSYPQVRRAASALGVLGEFPLPTLRRGMDVELEHGRRHRQTDVTHDSAMASLRIAIAHLRERRDYYALLDKYVEHAPRTNPLGDAQAAVVDSVTMADETAPKTKKGFTAFHLLLAAGAGAGIAYVLTNARARNIINGLEIQLEHAASSAAQIGSGTPAAPAATPPAQTPPASTTTTTTTAPPASTGGTGQASNTTVAVGETTSSSPNPAAGVYTAAQAQFRGAVRR